MYRKLAAVAVLALALTAITPQTAHAQRRLPGDVTIVERVEQWSAWSWRSVRDTVARGLAGLFGTKMMDTGGVVSGG